MSRRLTVSRRIALGFLLIILVMAGLAANSWMDFTTIGQSLSDLIKTSDSASHLEQLSAQITAEGFAIDDLVISADEGAMNQAKGILAGARETLNAVQEQAADADLRDSLSQAVLLFDNYAKGVETAIGFTQQINKIWPEVAKGTGDFASVLTPLSEGRVLAGDGRGAVDATVLLGEITDLQRQTSSLYNAAGPGLTPQIARELNREASDLDSAFDTVTVHLRLLRSRAPAAEGELLGKMLPGLGAYVTAVRDLNKLLINRAATRVQVIGPARKRLTDQLAEIARGAQQTQQTLAATALSDSKATTVRQTMGGIVGVVLALIIAVWIIRSMVPAIVRLTGAMQRLATGDLAVEVPDTSRRDEIGIMARTLQVFKENAAQIDRLHQEQAAMSEQAVHDKREALNRVADGFETSVKSLVERLTSSAQAMERSAQSLAIISEQTTQQASAVAAAVEQASANVRSVAAASEEMASSIAEIGRQTMQSLQVSQSAVDSAKRTAHDVDQMAASAQSIGEVVALIKSIAAQTNLLALNATIEAARAGEAGRGFAVVASEVKNLATQTAQATEEITEYIRTVQNSTANSVTAMKDIGAVITEINQITTAIGAAVEEQDASTREISRNVQEAARGTQEVSSNISDVDDSVRHSSDEAKTVLEAAMALAYDAEEVAKAIDAFLREVRAA
jgi:methyl-accepting chemotaxis protein